MHRFGSSLLCHHVTVGVWGPEEREVNHFLLHHWLGNMDEIGAVYLLGREGWCFVAAAAAAEHAEWGAKEAYRFWQPHG